MIDQGREISVAEQRECCAHTPTAPAPWTVKCASPWILLLPPFTPLRGPLRPLDARAEMAWPNFL